MSIEIIGTGSHVPGNIVTNDDLAKIIDTSDEWISSRTGIRQRRIASEETTSKMAEKAAKNALQDAGVEASELDMILVATLSGDQAMPSTACQLQALLDAKKAVCFDLCAACSGFIYALNTARAYIDAGLAATVLVVGAETLSKLLDWGDRSTCVLFGDGAGAVVVKGRPGLYECVMGSDGSKGFALTCGARPLNNPLVQGGEGISPISMDGQEIFRFALSVVPLCIHEVMEKAGVASGDVRYYILHQANLRMIKSVARKMKEPFEKFPTNVARIANTSSASIPILLDEMNHKGQLERGDQLVLCGFGGGLTWGAIALEW